MSQRRPFRESAHRALWAALGVLAGCVVRVWLFTLRVEVVASAALAHAEGRPWVYTFLHGRQFPLFAHARRKPAVVLVSLSRDGALQARALRLLGLRVVRGSSSSGGARGLAALVRRMRREAFDGAFAVDGPRGPYGVVKEGAVLAARATGGVLVPVGAAADRAWTFARAWDRYLLPKPFARVTLVVGAPLEPGGEGARERLERAIHAAQSTAETRYGRDGDGAAAPSRTFPSVRA